MSLRGRRGGGGAGSKSGTQLADLGTHSNSQYDRSSTGVTGKTSGVGQGVTVKLFEPGFYARAMAWHFFFVRHDGML